MEENEEGLGKSEEKGGVIGLKRKAEGGNDLNLSAKLEAEGEAEKAKIFSYLNVSARLDAAGEAEQAKILKELQDENDKFEADILPSPEIVNSKEYKEYWKIIIDSKVRLYIYIFVQGYVVPDLGSLEGKYDQCTINQCHDMDLLEEFSKLALEKYNEEKGTKHKLHGVVRGNYKHEFHYYLTFKVVEVEEGSEKEPIEWQALVYGRRKYFKVMECERSRYFVK